MTNVTEIQKNSDFAKLKYTELFEIEIVLRSYLQTHQPDTSKNCKVDVNDRPFDCELYSQLKQKWYSVWAEYFSRPVEEGL
jgi:hypothetical protein